MLRGAAAGEHGDAMRRGVTPSVSVGKSVGRLPTKRTMTFAPGSTRSPPSGSCSVTIAVLRRVGDRIVGPLGTQARVLRASRPPRRSSSPTTPGTGTGRAVGDDRFDGRPASTRRARRTGPARHVPAAMVLGALAAPRPPEARPGSRAASPSLRLRRSGTSPAPARCETTSGTVAPTAYASPCAGVCAIDRARAGASSLLRRPRTTKPASLSVGGGLLDRLARRRRAPARAPLRDLEPHRRARRRPRCPLRVRLDDLPSGAVLRTPLRRGDLEALGHGVALPPRRTPGRRPAGTHHRPGRRVVVRRALGRASSKAPQGVGRGSRAARQQQRSQQPRPERARLGAAARRRRSAGGPVVDARARRRPACGVVTCLRDGPTAADARGARARGRCPSRRPSGSGSSASLASARSTTRSRSGGIVGTEARRRHRALLHVAAWRPRRPSRRRTAPARSASCRAPRRPSRGRPAGRRAARAPAPARCTARCR